MTIRVKQPKLLIVEGRDEELFFDAALRDHLHLTDIQILPIGGKANLKPNLKALKKDPAFPAVTALAVVRDADCVAPGSAITAAARAFNSVRGALTAPAVGLPCPAGHGHFAAGPPRVGVFIMPNGVDDGMLETLCLQAVSTLAEFHCLADYFACLQGHGVVPNNLHKAHAHAWLASRPEPDRRVGEAAQSGYWLWTAPAFQDLWTFIQAL
ncbi:MAG: hypothetical protein L0Z62_02320 [Gemmataceae bacterium]|nr:hypothetical protein [Gemmataceae bacterium]